MTKSDFIKKVVAATTENEYTQKEVAEILEAEKKYLQKQWLTEKN